METPPTLQERVTLRVRGARSYESLDGLSSGFDTVEERDQIEVVVDVDPAGIATVDFLIDGQRWDPGMRASASSQYLSFVEPLEATVFADPTVTGLDRSTLCWGESGCTGITTRETWKGMLFVNHGILCDPLDLAYGDWSCDVRDGGTYGALVVDVVPDDVLNMRSGPGTAYFVVATLEPHATVEVLENNRLATDGALWRVVRADNGEIGWVNARFLRNSIAGNDDRTMEERLVDAFVDFAARPSDDTFAALPLAESVALGLGPDIATVVAGSALRHPDTWELDVEFFRAYDGPFSAFRQLAAAGAYEVTVGPYNYCGWSTPMPPPNGYADLTRISIADGFVDSCLMWSTVDFFVTADGTVAAITLDLGEP